MIYPGSPDPFLDGCALTYKQLAALFNDAEYSFHFSAEGENPGTCEGCSRLEWGTANKQKMTEHSRLPSQPGRLGSIKISTDTRPRQ
jgi:hypothetical protein